MDLATVDKLLTTTRSVRQRLDRKAEYSMLLVGAWSEAKDDEANIRWVRESWDILAPFMEDGVYVNYLMASEGDARVRASYGPNYGRLAQLKQKYDPTNFFRLNQNIKPGV